MNVPVLVNPSQNLPAGAIPYRIEGELVPTLHLELAQTPVYFDHYLLLWKEPAVQIELKPQTKSLRRTRSGAPVYLTQALGPGHIALGRNGAGRILSLLLSAGEALLVREHQFVAASDELEYSHSSLKGPATILFGGTSFHVERFRCGARAGMLWLHGYGDVFEAALKPGEQIDVEPAGWVCADASVQLEPIEQKLSSALLGGEQVAWHRFTGPGRVVLQSMYLHQTLDVQSIVKWARYE